MEEMRLLLVACALATASAFTNPQLHNVHTVYLLPMSGSLDQYLAARLTRASLFQVVTDPQKADAIFTDRIGEGFEQKMQELFPPPEVKKAATDDDDKDPVKAYKRPASAARGRGTVFLVDKASRNVLWSAYLPIRGTQPDEVNRRADHLVERLQKDLNGK